MTHHWKVRPKVPDEIVERFPEIDPILLQLLYSRGLNEQDSIDEFLEPDFSRDMHDPFLFRDMRATVSRIEKAIRDKEKTVIYGDYDADGVCATAVLSETIAALGGSVDVYIPFRETEGYGLNVRAVEELHTKGTRLIITVDCGTTNVREVARASELGMDVIITDHHDEPLELPKSYVIVNPELTGQGYPYHHLSGAGVAFKVATALLQHTSYGAKLGSAVLSVGWEKWLLDIVAISTVTDMVPMLGENRVIVRYGLAVLKKTKRIGLRELIGRIRTQIEDIDEETLGFQIGPRLNAAGRMNHASSAYRLLMTRDAKEASKLAEDLSSQNTERQRLTDATFKEALEQIGDTPAAHLVFAIGTTWAPGIIGLVAGKLVERYNRPAIVFIKSGPRYIGSGRSIDAFDITKALGSVAQLLDRYGGHPQACGFTLKNKSKPNIVGEQLVSIADKQLRGVDLTPVIDVDAEVVLDDVNWKLVEDVQRLAPFGEDAEQPRFLSRGLRVVAVDTVGKDSQHLRLHVSHATSEVKKTIGFRFGSWIQSIRPGDSIDCIFEVGMNEWNGEREIELKIVDLDHSGSNQHGKEALG
ncbi:MAG: single-stranded-DNA-specific exonuclease RecJ [Candidatus Kerfeldbacteria bacterium]